MRAPVAGVRPAAAPRHLPRARRLAPPAPRVARVPRALPSGRPEKRPPAPPAATGASGPGTGRVQGPLASPLTVLLSAGTDLKAVVAAARGAVDEGKGGKGSKFVPMVLL